MDINFLALQSLLNSHEKNEAPDVNQKYTEGRHVLYVMLIDHLWLLAPYEDFHCNQAAAGWAEPTASPGAVHEEHLKASQCIGL